jgi:histidinol-phosphate phosphatase family protein
MDKTESRPAVFLDRDGTLIEDCGNIRRPADVSFFPETMASLWLLQQNFLLFIVSNQAGVAEGALTYAEVDDVNDHVVKQLASADVTIAEVYWCPHKRSDNCVCIKPNPYFLRRAAETHRVDLKRSYVIGDHPCDVELAENVGARGAYVLTGHGQKHRRELTGNPLVVAGIAEAAEWIMSDQGDNTH